MVGDWLFINSVPLQVDAVSDNSCGFRDSEDTFYWAQDSFDNLVPIPLTSEILNQNGFTTDNNASMFFQDKIYSIVAGGSNQCNEYGCYYSYRNHSFVFETYKYCNSIGQPVKTWLERQNIIYNIRFVHELQHALRISGIDKQIVL